MANQVEWMDTASKKSKSSGVKKVRKKSSKKEEKIQMAVSKYLKKEYPDVVFVCDFAAGYRVPIWIGSIIKLMRSSSGLPDVIILEPNKSYHGLCIELKREDKNPFKKDGGLKSDEHLEKQYEVLCKLESKGYLARFAVGIEEAKSVIKEYMSNR